MPLRLALVAHDRMKPAIVAWAGRHRDKLARFSLVATGTTGARIAEACSGLELVRLKSGPLGGDQQLGAMIAEARLDALIFFVDPLSPLPHDVDVKALTRLAIHYDIPFALNEATAEIVIDALARR